MNKPYLTWEKVSNWFGHFTSLASNDTFILAGDTTGKLTVPPSFSFTLSPDPIHLISHLSSNIFAVSQNLLSIIELSSSSYKLLSTHKIKVTGFSDSFFWTKSAVFTEDLKEIYSLDDLDNEIVQVTKGQNKLIISTLKKSFILFREKAVQIGKKERNGVYGACELNSCIYAARPLGNLWQANFEGVVMTTTSYKLKSEKVAFGLMHPLGPYLISINFNHSVLLLLDPENKSIIYSENFTNNVVFYSSNVIWKYSSLGLFKSTIISCYQHFQDLVKVNLEETANFVIENTELHDLNLIEPLCVQVFPNPELISVPAFEKFCEIIKKLEENLQIPQIEFQSQSYKNDTLFDEFLKIAAQNETSSKRLKGKLHRKVKKYYTKSFVWLILLNWLLFVIYKLNLQLDKTLRLLSIASKSCHSHFFSLLYSESSSQSQQISSIL
jgi:hypothetical protein